MKETKVLSNMEKINPEISVIMSAYNTEEYVARAIDSILKQTFTNFEYIIIDNGSSDTTGKIIDEYASKDTRIKVVHKEENVGIANALNCAIDAAKGNYLYILDSDDWVMPDILEKMYYHITKFKADLVYCGFYMDCYVKKHTFSYIVSPCDADFERDDFRNYVVDDFTRMIMTVYWNKMWRLEYINMNTIRFRNIKMCDHHFNMDYLRNVERVCCISDPLYHYIKTRPNSYMQIASNCEYLNEGKRAHFRDTLSVFRHWGIDDKEIMSKLSYHHLANLVRCISDMVADKSHDKDYKRKEIKIILEDELTKYAIKNCSQKGKSKVLISIFSLGNVSICYFVGIIISLFQRIFPVGFYKMRSKIAQNVK